MRSGTKPLLVAACLAAFLVAAPAASATTVYASPTGGMVGTCESPDPISANPPCDLEHAVEDVVAATEVIVLPGNYTLGPADQVDIDIDVHGAPGQPRPVLASTAATGFTVSGGATLSDVRIEHTGINNAFSISNATVERVFAHTSSATACNLDDGALVRDSLCWTDLPASGAGKAVSLSNGNMGTRVARLRNVTAAATGDDAVGIYVGGGMASTHTIDAKNVIAFGTGDDAVADSVLGGMTAINFEYSNYDTAVADVPNGGNVTAPGTGTGNQIAAPVFANEAGGDFHQLASSPTVNAGGNAGTVPPVDLLGAADFDGDPRTIGPATDIGADEYSPPVVNQQPPATENPECQILRDKIKRLTKKIKKTDDPGRKATLKKKRRKARSRLAVLGCSP